MSHRDNACENTLPFHVKIIIKNKITGGETIVTVHKMEDLSARNGAKGECCYVITTHQLGYQATIDSAPCESRDDRVLCTVQIGANVVMFQLI